MRTELSSQFQSNALRILLFGLLMLLIFTVLPVSADTTVYSQGFEANDGGYTHTGTLDQWEWGIPTFGPSSAHSGVKVWGTNLDGNVPQNSNSYLTSPAIAIPALAGNQIARVRFWGWIAVDDMYDRGEFQVSKDGVNWVTKSELFSTMQGTWTEYWFDVSDYDNGNIYLRFRLYADYQDAFFSRPYNMAGMYVDDVAIIISDKPASPTTLTLEAWEDQAAYASCPWIYSWNGAAFVKDNDIYSTARGKTKEFTDYYTLNGPVVPENGQYVFNLQETDQETSFTDLVQLIAVDHPASVKIATDEKGNIWTYDNPGSPATATDKNGVDARSQISTENDAGLKVFNNDFVELDFSNLDTSNGATLVLRVLGFQTDGSAGNPTYADPGISIQTQDSGGQWVTRSTFNPRMDWATNAYNLKGYLTINNKVRLVAASCHENKYHIIDYVGMDTSSQAQITVTKLPLDSAVQSINGDVLSVLQASDNTYASMIPGESIKLKFAVPASAGEARNFVFVSEGYYEPLGTFFIYTWDGSQWAQRDGWSVEGSGDQTMTFDLSMWMPDPAGDYKVRIWQDYWYEGAGIDYVGLTQGATPATMVSAFDLKKSMDVKNQLIASDNNRDEWSSDQIRNRWVEIEWTGLIINNPPTTNPVSITSECTATPTISWTYIDADGNAQVQYEVEVWTGSGGSGTNMWDPAVGTGNDGSIVYGGISLVAGDSYYARVRAFDGTSWGGWSEASWTYPTDCGINNPPTTNPVSVTGECTATPTISWTYIDADGNAQVQYEVEVWTGSGGSGTNMWDPAVGTGNDGSIVYGGISLVAGDSYYARVRAFDGTDWGGWSEASWTYPTDCGIPTPEFPSAFLPTTMIIGFLGAVLYIQRTREH